VEEGTEMGPKTIHNLGIWREGIALVKAVYELTAGWPREELYGLTSQIRRSAVSIPTNLAEGVGRRSAGDTSRFAAIALGSAYELETLLVIAAELEFSSAGELGSIREQLGALTRRISSFARYQETKR
jgi:four helix bundle protein